MDSYFSGTLYKYTFLFCICLTPLVTYSVVLRIRRKFKNKNTVRYNNFKGPKGYPILGNCLEFLLLDHSEWIKVHHKWHREFGSRYRIFLGHQPYIAFTNAADVQKVIASTAHNDKSFDYDLVMPWLGTGLLTSRGKKWFTRRKLLTSAFHYKILEDFLPIFNEQSMTLVSVLTKEFRDGKAFNVFPYITRCALDIICETAMGKKINAQKELNNTYAHAVYRISELIQHRMVRPWLHINFLWRLTALGREEKRLLRLLHGFTEKVISERKKAHYDSQSNKENNDGSSLVSYSGEKLMYFAASFPRTLPGTLPAIVLLTFGRPKDKNRVAFLDLLVTAQANGMQLTDLDIREETDTFMFEGHDSVAASANWAVFLLGCNLDCQNKVHNELFQIFGGNKERPVTSADISKMKYLECCIKEALRLYPSVPFIGRAIKSDLELDADTVVAAGSTAFIMPYQLHRDPNVFPDPEKFDPERFSPKNSVERNPFAYVPFSAGPRNCIGQKFALMEEKVMLANIFRNFEVEATERREDLVLLAELIMRPKHGLHIKLKPKN